MNKTLSYSTICLHSSGTLKMWWVWNWSRDLLVVFLFVKKIYRIILKVNSISAWNIFIVRLFLITCNSLVVDMPTKNHDFHVCQEIVELTFNVNSMTYTKWILSFSLRSVCYSALDLELSVRKVVCRRIGHCRFDNWWLTTKIKDYFKEKYQYFYSLGDRSRKVILPNLIDSIRPQPSQCMILSLKTLFNVVDAGRSI